MNAMPNEGARPRRGIVYVVSTFACVVAAFVIGAMNASVRHGATASWNGLDEVASWSFLMMFASLLGALVLRQQPDNVVADVLLVGGLAGAIAVLGDQYAGYALVTRPGTWPGGVLSRYVSFLAFVASWFLAGVALPALFPTGHVVSRRWRIVVWIGAIGAAGWALMIVRPDAFTDDGLLGDVPGVDNPLAFPGAEVVGQVSDLFILALFGGMFGAIISLVVRAIRSRGIERQQLKVVAYTIAVVTVVQLVVANTLQLVGGEILRTIWDGVSFLSILAVPGSIGVALLRYRLYDIDRLINRTLVYVVLTALLAGTYVGAVLLFGYVTSPITEGSDPSIAAATLIIAGLFFPLRRRVQAFIDRRFYRSRYDAQRTLEAFASRLRQETDLASLRAQIESVARDTLKPASATLWLAPRTWRGRVLP